MKGRTVPQNIEDLFEDKARAGDGQFAIAFALMQIAREQKSVATQLKYLGVGDAASSMGAMEFLAMQLREGFQEVGRGLDAVAEAVPGVN